MFFWHNCLKSTSSMSLYSFWTRLKWLKIAHFLFGKLQTTDLEDQTSEVTWTSSNSEITAFYTGKNNKITGSFSWGRIIRYRLQWFLWCCFWSPYFFNRPFCDRPCCKTSIICISCWSRWFTSTNPKNLTAFTSLPSSSYTGEKSF